ncbi:MAG: tetratricopeptide repeat protein [Deltaproteobacteria bacterium]|nr:tetratricopeptide repeat protein [Deltaproteobacteria bacterium]
MASAPNLTDQRRLELAVVCLEVLDDAAGAAEHLRALVEPNAPLALWALYQLAVACRSGELFDRWHAEQLDVTPERERSGLLADVGLFRTLTGDESASLLRDAGDWAHVTAGARQALQLLLAAEGRWEDLVRVMGEDGPAAQLARAHLVGDRLDRAAEREQLLGALAGVAPLFVGDALLEAAFARGDDAAAAPALRLRQEALAAHKDLLAQAAATDLLCHVGRSPGQVDHLRLSSTLAAAAWHHLLWIVERRGHSSQRTELARLYLREVPRCARPLADVLRLRAAELFMAGDAWAEALEALPQGGESDVYAQLAQLYRTICLVRLGQWAELALLVVAASAGQPPEDRRLLLKLALLLASKDPRQAQRVLRRFESELPQMESPLVVEIGGLLLAIHRQRGDKQAAARIWGLLADRATTVEERAFFAFASGVALLEAGKRDTALLALELARRSDGETPEVLTALAIARTRNREWDHALTALEAVAQRLAADDQRELLRRVAHLAWTTGGPRRALELLQRVLGDSRGDLASLKEVAALHLRVGEVDQAIRLLTEAAATTSDQSEAAALHCACGKLYRGRLKDPAAAEQSYRAALSINPLHPEALNGLRDLLARTGRLEDLPPVLTSLLQIADADDHRMKLHLELSWLHRKQWERSHRAEDAEACIEQSHRVLGIDKMNEDAIRNLAYVSMKLGRWDEIIQRLSQQWDSDSALRALRKAYEATGRWAELAKVCERLAERASDREEQIAAAIQAGDLYRDRLGDPKAAEACYRRASAADGRDGVSLQRLGELLRGEGRAAELATVLRQRLASAAPAERAAVHLELGRLSAGPLGRARQAIEHFEAVVEQDPGHLEALRALDPLFEREGRPADRARVLERLLQLAEGSGDALPILLKLGDLYGQLQDERSVLRVAARLQALFPEDETALQFAEQVYESQQRYGDLCELFDRRIRALEKQEQGADRIAEFLARKGELELGRLGATAEAVESFARLLDLRPDDEGTLGRLEELLGQMGHWQRLVALYERHAGRVGERPKQIEYLRRAAQIAQRQLGDEAETVRLYERVHALDPSDAVSFSVMEKRLERQNDYKRLVTLLLERAEMVSSKPEELDCILRAAAICEKIPSIEQAVRLYQRALSINPASMLALEALARIYESLERWEDLLNVTGRQIQLESEPARRALLYFKCGSVMETQHADEKEAFRYYIEAVKTSTTCLPALHSLRDLHARHEEWEKVAETLAMEARVWSDPKGKADVLAQLAEIYATRLGDRARAMEYYKQAIQTHAKCMPAALALFEAYANQGDYAEATVWGEVYARRGHLRGSRSQRAEFFVQWADVLRKMERSSEAVEALLRALEIRPGLPAALFGLLALCREAPDAFDFAGAFTELLKDASKREDSQASAILSTAAGVLAEHRLDLDAALELYGRALEIGGDQVQIVRPLADLYVQIGRDGDALALMQRCQNAAVDFAEWIDATLWIADYHTYVEGDYRRAAELCRTVLDRQPNRDDVRIHLGRVLVLAGQPVEALAEFQRGCDQQAAKGTDVAVLARSYHALGLAAARAGSHQTAVSNWRRACDLAPSWPYPYIALARRAFQVSEFVDAERELRQAEQGIEERDADVLRAQAEFYARRSHLDRSITIVRRAVRLHDPHLDDRVNLARYLLAKGEASKAVDELRATTAERPDYLPAYDLLVEAWQAAGRPEMARRASQVVQLAVGGGAAEAEPVVPERPLGEPGWERITAELANSPLDALWQGLSAEFERRYRPELPPPGVAVRPPLALSCRHLGGVFGLEVDLAVSAEPTPLVRSVGRTLVVSQLADSMTLPELRALLALGMTAMRLGHGPTFGLAPEAKLELGRVVASMLLPEHQMPPEVRELLNAVSRRDQKRLSRILTQHRVALSAIDELARNWVASVESVCVKIALLVTEDLPSLARVLALQLGVAPSWAAEGGLLLGVPELQYLVQYFLSDTFHQHKLAAWSTQPGG